MKALLAIVAAASCLVPLYVTAEPVHLTTWNLEWFPGRHQVSDASERAVHISLVHEELEQIQPDVLLLQEVRDAKSAELAARILPRMKVVVTSTFPGRQQVSILSRFVAQEVGQVIFPRVSGDPPRGFVRALFPTEEDDEFILIYAVHLKSNRGGILTNMPKREEAVRRLVADERAYRAKLAGQGIRQIFTIVGGDFNTDPTDNQFVGENSVRIFADADFQWTFSGIPAEERVTWVSNGKYPDACFDGFFIRPNTNGRVSRPLVHLQSNRASDHRAVSLAIDP